MDFIWKDGTVSEVDLEMDVGYRYTKESFLKGKGKSESWGSK